MINCMYNIKVRNEYVCFLYVLGNLVICTGSSSDDAFLEEGSSWCERYKSVCTDWPGRQLGWKWVEMAHGTNHSGA